MNVLSVLLLWGLPCLLLIQEVCLQEEGHNEEDCVHEKLQPLNCSTSEVIRGGQVSYSQGGMEGSVLTYHCEAGHFPYPVSHRLCSAEGEWSTMREANGRRVSQALCKEVLCPGQVQLENGDLWPRGHWFRPGENQSFSCQEEFTLLGSDSRNCSLSGEWTGTNPVCHQQRDDDNCNDPGVPPGALRSTGRFRTGEKVQYRCQSGLVLLGPEERVCLENREWSGSEPRCQAPYAFDSPGVVAEAMGGSLAGVMDVLSPEFKKKPANYGRMLRVSEGGGMNIFILLDTSGSITQEHFQQARAATQGLIRKLDSYEVDIKYQVTSYASKAIDIVRITDFSSSNAEKVIARLNKFDYTSHGRASGTNLYAALETVINKMAFLKVQDANNRFNQTQNIIIIETDGYSNTGNSPLIALARIRDMLDYPPTSKDHTEEMLLDVYVFGVGNVVNRAELNNIASNKRNEQHLFILQDYQQLGEVFNSMISDKSVTMCGVAQEEVPEQKNANRLIKISYTSPWHVTIATSNCQGSLVSQNWVLTAAHCFPRHAVDPNTVTIKHGEGQVKAKRVVVHHLYNVRQLAPRNVSEFYDYDIALIQLKTSVPLSAKARPICLPCTKASNRALKMSPNSTTCQQHMKELLPVLQEETTAYFLHKNEPKRKQTHIITGSKRADCSQPAQKVLKPPTDVSLEEYITDRFLCSGGSTGHVDAVTCKGDSGGSLFLQRRMRYFQVGVVSWGTRDLCKNRDGKHTNSFPPPDARDFHISVFSMMPWLREHLAEEIPFLPDES